MTEEYDWTLTSFLAWIFVQMISLKLILMSYRTYYLKDRTKWLLISIVYVFMPDWLIEEWFASDNSSLLAGEEKGERW